jgi:hypothetical protein
VLVQDASPGWDSGRGVQANTVHLSLHNPLPTGYWNPGGVDSE